jgi:hypothetical protein
MFGFRLEVDTMTAFLILIIIILIIVLISTRSRLQQGINNLLSQLREREKHNSELNSKVEELRARNDSLSKYSGLVDLEQKGNEIISEAAKVRDQAQLELDNAKEDADKIRKAAATDATESRKTAINYINNSTLEAKLIVEKAHAKAQEIAGDAYKALQNSEELRRTAVAMKNIIEGYGDEYLVPTFSLLDDLAQEFGHTDAGQKLQLTRERSRLMIKNKTAAKCEYVESNRKETAVTFVLDAFNGKVDSILSKVKKDNYGVLEQKIKDSYQLVNANGKAFRNAVIMPEYLDSRLDELKWAVVAQELKWQEQEEQRRIKEQIREEEKAKKDFEKAIREAEKEEALLRKLIEKVQKEVEEANADERSRYEEKLTQLEQKLKIAEEKNQRALSMAQQTKSGNVYIISNIGSFGEDVYKIGMTRRLDPRDRVYELSGASVPFEFDVHSMIFSENAPALEHALHKKFMRKQMNKVNPRKEFFKISLTELMEELERMNIETKWTILAEAKHYRESLLIEKAIENDNQQKIAWERRQLQEVLSIAESEDQTDEMISDY